jgi:hypothetical protein
MFTMKKMLVFTARLHGQVALTARARYVTTNSARRVNVGQGGCLDVRLPGLFANVDIRSAWIDHCELWIPASVTVEEDAKHGAHGLVRLTQAPSTTIDDTSSPIVIRALIPEKFDVQVLSAGGDVSITNKVEGDVDVVLPTGNISVSKLRGMTVALSTNLGKVTISALVEAAAVKLRGSQVC